MGQQIVPYQQFETLTIPQPGEARPGQMQGVYFTLDPEGVEPLLAKIAGWFEGRAEVAYVDHGTTDKQGDGYIILEWSDIAVDPLFQAILRDEEAIIDYCVYNRFDGQEG